MTAWLLANFKWIAGLIGGSLLAWFMGRWRSDIRHRAIAERESRELAAALLRTRKSNETEVAADALPADVKRQRLRDSWTD